eukprot:356231-Chlamydomonas_euryale.AAC.3
MGRRPDGTCQPTSLSDLSYKDAPWSGRGLREARARLLAYHKGRGEKASARFCAPPANSSDVRGGEMLQDSRASPGGQIWPDISRVRVTGSGSTVGYACVEHSMAKGIKQQGTVTKGTPLCTVLSHPIPTPTRQPGHENRAQAKALSRHKEHGLSTAPPSHTSPSTNNTCSTTDLSGIRMSYQARMILATWPRRVSRADVHQLGQPRRCAHLSRRVQPEGAVRPHAGDLAQVGVVGADERLQLVVREDAGLRYSVEKAWAT